MKRLYILLAGLLLLACYTSAQTDTIDFFDVECNATNPTECDAHANSQCLAFDATITKCGCAEAYEKNEDRCLIPVPLDEVCEEGLCICTAKYSECMFDSDGEGTKRCECKDSFLAMKVNNTKVCAVILTKDKVPDCTLCEDNGGTCYGLDEVTKEGCKCPISKNGMDCNETLVEVKCDAKNFTKHICYTPGHVGVNFSRTDAASTMFADGHGTDEACKGKLLSADSEFCVAGQVELILPLKAGKMERCGTEEFNPDLSTRSYDTTITVEKGGSSGESVFFKTYCAFTKQTQSKFNGVAVNVREGNSRGEHLSPNITFDILNYIGSPIPDSVAIRHGDSVRYRINLVADGTYSAIRVERCTASSSPRIPDPHAATEMLILGSCPVAGNNIINATTNFQMKSNLPNELQTGLFGMFKMTKGSSVFMHCTLKLCLNGNEAMCAPVNCGDHNGLGKRKRRQADNEDSIEIVKGVEVYEQELGSSMVIGKADFAVLISILVILLVFFIALAILLYLKIRGRGQKVDDIALTEKPQRFALPRIRTPNMRM